MVSNRNTGSCMCNVTWWTLEAARTDAMPRFLRTPVFNTSAPCSLLHTKNSFNMHLRSPVRNTRAFFCKAVSATPQNKFLMDNSIKRKQCNYKNWKLIIVSFGDGEEVSKPNSSRKKNCRKVFLYEKKIIHIKPPQTQWKRNDTWGQILQHVWVTERKVNTCSIK